MKIGFIGLGLMGSRMAGNLIKAGYQVHLFNRSAAKARSLSGDKTFIEQTPDQLATKTDLVITMLSTPEVVQEVALGENGFLPAMKQGSVWIDCSTVNPSFSIQMAKICEQLGFNHLDAPVAGSVVPAEKGELIFLVGGKKSIVKYCDPILKSMGKYVIHAGENGKGSALKLVNNLVMGISVYGFIEGLLLAESLGIKKEQVFDFLDGSPVVAPMVSMKRHKFFTGNYEPEFPLQWLQKDLHLAAQTAYENGVALPATNTVKEIFAMAKKAGLGERDFTSVYPYLNANKA